MRVFLFQYRPRRRSSARAGSPRAMGEKGAAFPPKPVCSTYWQAFPLPPEETRIFVSLGLPFSGPVAAIVRDISFYRAPSAHRRAARLSFFFLDLIRVPATSFFFFLALLLRGGVWPCADQKKKKSVPLFLPSSPTTGASRPETPLPPAHFRKTWLDLPFSPTPPPRVRFPCGWPLTWPPDFQSGSEMVRIRGPGVTNCCCNPCFFFFPHYSG